MVEARLAMVEAVAVRNVRPTFVMYRGSLRRYEAPLVAAIPGLPAPAILATAAPDPIVAPN